MRVILKDDIITNISHSGVELLAPLPSGVDLGRIRVVDRVPIDLATLSEIWVKQENGVFVLHAMYVPGAQLVQMTYNDRDRLINDNGTIRLKTAQETADEDASAYAKKLETAVQKHLDTTAQAHGYDSILSARSYAGYFNEFQDEGRAMLIWSSLCWRQYNKTIESGERPDINTFINQLPEYNFSKAAADNYRALILRRANALEEKGFQVEAQLLRLTVL